MWYQPKIRQHGLSKAVMLSAVHDYWFDTVHPVSELDNGCQLDDLWSSAHGNKQLHET
jgi:hypothetical protein